MARTQALEYKEKLYTEFWDAHYHYQLSDMLEIALSILNILQETTDEDAKNFVKKYKPQLEIYYESTAAGLAHWYKHLKMKKTCKFDYPFLKILEVGKHMRSSMIWVEALDEAVPQYVLAETFKEIRAHIVHVMGYCGKFIEGDLIGISRTPLPPDIPRRGISR